MNPLRRLLLCLLALVPLATLIHKNNLHRWDFNRAAMVAPDEFSYLLTADAILHHHEISTRPTLGIDTFYPPGFPLLLAGWALCFGLTAFAAHALNALLLCAAIPVVYLFSRRLLELISEGAHRRFAWSDSTQRWIALLVAGIFAANWHVLETALYVFSEPAFMLVTLAWLALALRWQEWHLSAAKTLAVALLAVAAWSIRGAGIVCVAVTCLYPLASLARRILGREKAAAGKRIGPIALVILLPLGYQLALLAASPSKSLAAGAASHGYTRQLLDGLTRDGTLHLDQRKDWPELAARVRDLAVSHMEDYGASFVPWFRDPPDAFWRELLAKIFGGLGIAGFLLHLARRRPRTRFLDAYIVCYFALYLVWPFDMLRFWSPILPVMLVFAADAVRAFWDRRGVFTSSRMAAALLALLLLLSAEELAGQLGNYQRRVNLVSDSLAGAAAAVVRMSPDPGNTIVDVAGSDGHFVFAWYFPRLPADEGRGFMPQSPKNGQHAEQLLLAGLKRLEKDPAKRLFAIAYFNDPNYRDVFENMRKIAPGLVGKFRIVRAFSSHDVATVWEFEPIRGPASRASRPTD